MDWDDLRHFLVAVQAGTLTRAAEALGVNRTTVSRRIAQLEQRMGTPLLEQGNAGYRPTATGRLVLESAHRMAEEAQRLQRQLQLPEAQLAGPLRIAAPIGLGPEFLPELALFTRIYPGIRPELITLQDPAAAVVHRKADVAIAVSNHPPEHLEGLRVARLERAVYASSDYLSEQPAGQALAHHRWVGWGRDMSHALATQWMRENLPQDVHIGAEVNSWTALREAVASGLGVAFLWCFLADEDTRLLRIRDPEPALGMDLWLLTHPGLPGNARTLCALQTLPGMLRARVEHTVQKPPQ